MSVYMKARLQEFAADGETSYLLLFTKLGYLCIYKNGELIATKSSPYDGYELPKLRFAQSADVMFIASGTRPVKILKRTGTDTFSNLSDFKPSPGYFDSTTMTDGTTITPSARGGNITLTASTGVFTEYQVGNQIMLRQKVSADTVSQSATGDSSSLLAGPAGWKIVTHGTWKGTVNVEYSDDNSNWYTLRTYTSDSDFNATESGTFDDQTYIRLSVSLTSGTLTADLTRFPYTYEGWANITAYTDSTHVSATVKKRFINTDPSDDWAFGSWSEAYGYPSCVTFFQDRLCFAATYRQPYMVWMSATGDYYNFGVERVEGTVTDDSAIAISFISRKDYRIKHLVAHADLLVMTEGNEWIVSGAEVVTPTNVSPRVQTSRGCTDVAPEMIGGEMIYVQRHGKTVRDLQYNFGSDSYDGMDLSILAKHITQDREIVDSAYRQEPDYMMFFVLDDGTCACLTYVKEQQVYAWSRMATNGNILAVEVVGTNAEDYYNGGGDLNNGGDELRSVKKTSKGSTRSVLIPSYAGFDEVYFVVERDNGYFLEKLSNYYSSEFPDSYVMVDCAVHGYFLSPATSVTNFAYANQNVTVLADGKRIDTTGDRDGVVSWTTPAYNVCVGLPYASIWELPNIEMQLNDGTLQGRKKKVSEVILRLDNSLGGRVGINTNKTDMIKYDELDDNTIMLYSGEKMVTVPNVTAGGFNDKGRVVITSDEPYPLSISSIVRAVVPGG